MKIVERLGRGSPVLLALAICVTTPAQASGPIPQGLVVSGASPAGGVWLLHVVNVCPGPIVVDWADYQIDAFDADWSVATPVRSFAGPPITLAPGEIIPFVWDGKDDAGNPVAPGNFGLHQRFGPQTWSYAHWTGFPFGALHAPSVTRYLNPPFAGKSSTVVFHSPSDAGRTFAFGIAFGSSVGLASCAGIIPLDDDPLLQYVLGPSNAILSPMIGTLDANGASPPSAAPRLSIPDEPWLYGLSFVSCFVVIDPAAPCFFRRIGDPTTHTIWP